MDLQILQEFKDFSLYLKDLARGVIAEQLQQSFSIETKQDNSFVTSIDTDIENLLSDKISERYPSHGIIGEENGEKNRTAEFVWTLDPIDGTEELVHGVPLYGTIIALLHNNTPVLGLIDHSALDLCTVGGKGIGVYTNGKRLSQLAEVSDSPRLYMGSRHQFLRGGDSSTVFEQVSRSFPNVRVFCTCYGFTGIVNGQADVAVEYNLKIWDLAAAEALTKEVGGEFVKVGEQIAEDGLRLYGAVFGKKKAVSDILEVIGNGSNR